VSCTGGLDCEPKRVVLGPLFFSISGHSRPKFDQTRMKAILKKWIYGFKNTKYFFDADLIDASGFPSSRNVEAFFHSFRSNSYRFRVGSG